jgi:N-acetylmuramoyl-L-alanine amidase
MTTGQDLLKEAEKHIGDEYVFGADVPLVQGDDYHGETDCAEMATEVGQEVTGRIYGAFSPKSANPEPATAAWYADMVAGNVIQVTVDRAMRTPGALLLRRSKTGGHIAFSDGKGGTVEAKGKDYGVVRDEAAGRGFQWGIFIPNVCYEET